MGDPPRQRAVTKRTSATTEGKLNSATTDSPPTIITVHDLISAYFARPLQNSIPRRTHSAAMAACYAKLLPQFRNCEHVIHVLCSGFSCSRCLSRRRRCIKLVVGGYAAIHGSHAAIRPNATKKSCWNRSHSLGRVRSSGWPIFVFV